MADIIILGGGIIGMLTARELSMRGARVRILEKGEVAKESTWAGGGIISPLYPWRYPDSVTLLAKSSQASYPGFCSSLLESTGIDPEYTVNGLLIAGAEDTETAIQWKAQHSINLQAVNRNQIKELEPAWALPPDEALWMESVGQVRNPRLAKSLLADIKQRGVRIDTRSEALELVTTDGNVTGVRTTQGIQKADTYVVCTGAWTGKFLGSLAHRPRIDPVRGQMILFHTKPGVISRMVLEENRYIIPRRDGRVLFGSTLEHTGFDKSTTQAAREELVLIATQRFPVLKNYAIEKQWAGLRPASPAGVPYITRHPDLANLYVNAGHFRNGVVLGPASATLMADLIQNRRSFIDPAYFSIDAPRD